MQIYKIAETNNSGTQPSGPTIPGSSPTGPTTSLGGSSAPKANKGTLGFSMKVSPQVQQTLGNAWKSVSDHPMMQGAKPYMDAAASPEGWKAFGDYGKVSDPNLPWTNSGKIESAYKLHNYAQTPQGQSLLQSNPHIRQQYETYKPYLDSPLSQAARYGAPMLNAMTSDPTNFGRLISAPGISDITTPFIQAAGMPGLMAAHAYLSGDKNKWQNWNTLTGGVHSNPDAPFNKALQSIGLQGFAKSNSHNLLLNSKLDLIDKYLQRYNSKQ